MHAYMYLCLCMYDCYFNVCICVLYVYNTLLKPDMYKYTVCMHVCGCLCTTLYTCVCMCFNLFFLTYFCYVRCGVLNARSSEVQRKMACSNAPIKGARNSTIINVQRAGLVTLNAEFVLSIGVMHVVVRRTVVNGSFSDASIAPWPIMRIAVQMARCYWKTFLAT